MHRTHPACTRRARPTDIPALPLSIYFFYDDIEAVVGVLGQAGVSDIL